MLETLNASWQTWVFAALALTVVRMVPVALCLFGAGLDRATVGVIGWFGPRGLASVVFALLAFDALPGQAGERALSAITTVVLMSIVAHGVSAAPIAAWYDRQITSIAVDRPEHGETTPLPTRRLIRARSNRVEQSTT
jgi:NhaP-type Na+/H+ or K+/H+ antiporter